MNQAQRSELESAEVLAALTRLLAPTEGTNMQLIERAVLLNEINAELRTACARAFNLIKESGFSSGLIEEEFDGTLRALESAISREIV